MKITNINGILKKNNEGKKFLGVLYYQIYLKIIKPSGFKPNISSRN